MLMVNQSFYGIKQTLSYPEVSLFFKVIFNSVITRRKKGERQRLREKQDQI